MNRTVKKIVKRFLIILSISVLAILGLMFILPKIFSEVIEQKVNEMIVETVEGDVKFDDISLSFYKQFPYLTAVISNPSVEGFVVDSLFSDKLFEAKSVSLGVNLFSLVNSKLSFDKIFIEDPVAHILVDEKGTANYNIFKSNESEDESSSSYDLGIERFEVYRGNVFYDDLAAKISFVASGFNYVGKGNMREKVFKLTSAADITSFDFNFDGIHYIKEKPVSGNLETLVDTESLRFGFERNDLKIKELPISFNGFFGFIENGYDMLFDVKTSDASLSELLSIVPPSYQEWFSSTTFSGMTKANLLLEGNYVISDSLKPNLAFGLHIDNGFIQHNKASKSIEELNLSIEMLLPDLDLDKLSVTIDTLYFQLDNKVSKLKLSSQGFKRLALDGSIALNTSLHLFSEAIGLSGFKMSGDLSVVGDVKGIFAQKEIVKHTLRRQVVDTIVSSVPRVDMSIKLANGLFKFKELPEAIERVDLEMNVVGKDSLYQNIAIDISRLNLVALNTKVEGHLKVNNLRDFNMVGAIKSKIDLDNIKAFLPIEGVTMRGLVDFSGDIAGTFEPKRKRFPIIKADLKVSEGFLLLEQLPTLPIEDINVHAIVNSSRGSFSDVSIQILPISFKLANKPFYLSASLFNLNNLHYTLRSKGSLNLDDLYQIFKVKGLDVTGQLHTNLYLKGSQEDALAGRLDQLKNGGRFEVDNIKVSSELFPKPLVIKKGVFKFFKEQVKFERFEAVYGSSTFAMTGKATNVLNYLLKQDTLRGTFDISSKYFNVDEFMVFAPSTSGSKAAAVSSVAPGVIQIPSNVSFDFNATAEEIKYLSYHLKNFKGGLHIGKGHAALKETTFDLIGTSVAMTGTYLPTGLRKADFSYTIKAENFDIQRAYKEIELFREMVSMAKNAYGEVSLQYGLTGHLNGHMFPVLPSLVGEGTLSLDNIQFKGFKLLGAIADKTESKSLTEGRVSDVVIHSSVKDNVLSIARTRMKMAGFRPRFEGQVSLDGELNIGFRLGLPPLGIIGIPMRITGNAEDFDIELGRYKADETMGTEDEEEELDVGSIQEANSEAEKSQSNLQTEAEISETKQETKVD